MVAVDEQLSFGISISWNMFVSDVGDLTAERGDSFQTLEEYCLNFLKPLPR